MTMKDFGAKNSDLKGIQYLRNVEDADALVAYMKEAKKVSNKAVMVGGGYIGLEVTANLVQNGFEGQCPACYALPCPAALCPLYKVAAGPLPSATSTFSCSLTHPVLHQAYSQPGGSGNTACPILYPA